MYSLHCNFRPISCNIKSKIQYLLFWKITLSFACTMHIVKFGRISDFRPSSLNTDFKIAGKFCFDLIMIQVNIDWHYDLRFPCGQLNHVCIEAWKTRDVINSNNVITYVPNQSNNIRFSNYNLKSIFTVHPIIMMLLCNTFE